MAYVLIEGYMCERCLYRWGSRTGSGIRSKSDPKVCPKCKTPYWNQLGGITGPREPSRHLEQETGPDTGLDGDPSRLPRRTQRMARIKKRQLNVWARPDGKIPAAAYLRVSSTGQDVENSVDAQLERISRWAEEHGYVIVKVFTDRARTGRLANRPDFKR